MKHRRGFSSLFTVLVVLFGEGVQGQRSQVNEFQNPTTPPVPILRQINSLNDDGSYSYGYEGGDGSYKIEVKSVTGEVKGKYGYYDPQGQLREIEYGATMDQGFVPSGSGIDPVLSASFNQPQVNSVGQQQKYVTRQTPSADDDGQYRPAEHEDPYAYIPEVNEPPRGQRGQEAHYQFQHQQQQAFPVSGQERPRRLRPSRHHSRQHEQQVALNQFEGQVYQELPVNQGQQFQGHPASNFNFNSGTYSISY